MGTLLVESSSPFIKAGLLLHGLTPQLLLHLHVPPLMGCIILRTTRPPTLQIYPQHHPPGRQTAQPQYSCVAGKRWPVVTANGLGQPVPLKETLKTSPHRFAPRISHRSHFQHIPAELISHRQRLAPLLLGSIPPTLKIHRPHLVGFSGFVATIEPTRLLSGPQNPRLY